MEKEVKLTAARVARGGVKKCLMTMSGGDSDFRCFLQ
jgi:hypothetical protein